MRVLPVPPTGKVKLWVSVSPASEILSFTSGWPSRVSMRTFCRLASQTFCLEKRSATGTLPTQARSTEESTLMVAVGGAAPHCSEVSAPIALATSTCSGRCRLMPSRFSSGPAAGMLPLSTSTISRTCEL
ncbi:MAG: hypothetical protein GAK31_00048 [Stenotrophomonas maltophilia]|uniref:Uncharacterized protein n=1 Tax=Stenotrophomonas maltophilia TaxID=40324 RepID=A0A7V8FIJ5_STEMA|nr:MAG: hypothetical protein GAK31_00048 [Stenotrophomonas maltophilia]